MKVKSEKVWPPGFRFHPTDDELVLYYLKRKICKKRIKVDIIAELDVYKWDPEELPGQSLLKSGDRQWFFFSPRDRKYPNGARSNRATRQGYWKATGKDRIITCNSRNVGVKKTLVFYRGRAPNGERTDWVMHEYTLDEEELKRCQNVQDYYALYKVFKKSGPGPKNGEQYGALFIEEEWVDDDDLDVTITVDSKIPTKHPHVENTVDSKISTEHLDVENTVDLKIPMKQPNGFAAVDNWRSDGQEPSPLYDIEDFMSQLADEPLPSEPQINYACDAPQVVGEEEAQGTLVNPSSGEVVFSQPIGLCNEQASFDFTQSASSNLQLYEASEVTSVPKNSEQVLQIGDGDFLEIDDLNDLIGPEPTPSTVEKPVENLQFGEFNGLSELDLFHDASMFLQDLGTVDQQTIANVLSNDMVIQAEQQFQSQSVVNQVDHQVQPTLLVHQMDHQLQPNSVVDPMNHLLQPNSVVNQTDYLLEPNSVVSQMDYLLQPHLSNQPWMDDLGAEHCSSELWIHGQQNNVFTPAELNQGFPCAPTSGLVDQSTKCPTEENQNQSGQQGGGATSWISSSLWAFVESIPTTPASASENPLVNRAFERMSSFSRMRITARNTNVTGGEAAAVTRRQPSSSSRGFLLLSVFGALCAIIWMLMGTMRVSGRCILS